ncbi:MAG: hypothetical protein QM520_05875 [Gammaproteobacteria bacterium]|nr:hypothetical protein [Gammaproteobacteria bacterium]
MKKYLEINILLNNYGWRICPGNRNTSVKTVAPLAGCAQALYFGSLPMRV